MNSPFDADLEACAQLGVSECLLSVHATMGEDKLGDGLHPHFSNAKRQYARLLVKLDEAALLHHVICGPGG